MNRRTLFQRAGGVSLLSMVAALAVGPSVSAQLQPPTKDKQKSSDPTSRVVQFTTGDDVIVEADYYAPKIKEGAKAPVAILIHMYKADRSSWKPLVPSLLKAGFAVLAYDIRGTGGSIEPEARKLGEGYTGKDPDHFKEAWQDAAAAKEWLGEQPECDTTWIAVIGASIGSSISLHYGSRDQEVKAIVCLSPGTKYFGMNSREHIKACGDRAILLIAPKSEYKTVKKLIKASDKVAKGKKYPGTREQHGTNLLLSDAGKKVSRKITAFLKKARPVPEKDESENEGAGKKARPRRSSI